MFGGRFPLFKGGLPAARGRSQKGTERVSQERISSDERRLARPASLCCDDDDNGDCITAAERKSALK